MGGARQGKVSPIWRQMGQRIDMRCCALLVCFVTAVLSREMQAPEQAPVAEALPQPVDPDADLGHKDVIYNRLDPAVYKSITGTGDPNQLAEFQPDNNTIVLSDLPLSKKTVKEVNAAAPVYTIPTPDGSYQARPHLTQISQGKNGATAKDGFVQSMSVDPKKPKPLKKVTGSGVDPSLLEGKAQKGKVSSKAVDPDTVVINGRTGFFLSLLAGVRVATPFFGSGFNFCIDRYVSSFPKIGVVIPNPIAWILPEFMDMASSLSTSVRLPSGGVTAPTGVRVAPTSDGFVIWFPSVQPTTIPVFGFRYGVQVAQLFGIDFGFGWTQTFCSVDFVRV